jgi:hypothetical protein
MNRERRYKVSLMNNKQYVIDEADLNKLKENAGEMLVQLKQVIVHPSSIVSIEPFYVEYIPKVDRVDGTVRIQEYIPPAPVTDLFNQEVLKLTDKIGIKHGTVDQIGNEKH